MWLEVLLNLQTRPIIIIILTSRLWWPSHNFSLNRRRHCILSSLSWCMFRQTSDCSDPRRLGWATSGSRSNSATLWPAIFKLLTRVYLFLLGSFDDNSRLMINPNILPVYNAKFANWNYNIDMCRTGAFEEVKRRRFKDDLSETESQKERNEFNNQIDREWILCLNEINFAKKFEFITCKKCKFNIHKLWLDEWNKVIVDLKNRWICWKEKIC